MSSGIPFPRGLLADAAAVRLLDSAGREMPLQASALARWDDGSVRWLLVDFQVDLKANDTFQGRLEMVRAGRQVRNGLNAREANGGIEVDTGAITARFGADGRATIVRGRTAVLDPFCESRIGLLEFSTHEVMYGQSRGEFAFKADAGQVALEESGPLRCVVRLKGWHWNDKGQRVSPSVIRFEFYRGLPLVRVMHTFVMSENPNEVMVRGIELVSRVPGAEKIACILGAEKPVELGLAGREGAYLLQYDAGELHYPHLNEAEPRCEVVHDIGWRKQAYAGGRAQGWMRAAASRQAVTFAMPFMRESWPKGLGAKANGELRAGLWPAEYGPWDMRRVEIRYPVPGYFLEYLADKAEARHWRGYMAGATMLRVSAMGLARTHDVFCWVHDTGAPEPAGADLVRMAEKPLYAYATPGWFCDSKALGSMLPYSPEKYPKHEALLEGWLTWLLEEQERWKWYGILDYGDVQYVVRSPEYSKYPPDDRWWRHSGKYGWFNSGHSSGGGPLLEGLCAMYARTGDRRYLDFAMQRGRHKMDVDTIHYYPEPDGWRVGAMRRHGGFDHFAGDANPSGAHTLINGLPDLYFLTGYRRAADVALLVADSKMNREPLFSATRSGLTDANAFILAYLLKPERKYMDRAREYFERHVERQKQPAWPKFWIDYATAPVRELLTTGDAASIDLASRAFLADYAAIGQLGGAGEPALAYEIRPSGEYYRLVAKYFERAPPENARRTILNSAGILNELPHMMWAMEDGRRRFGDPVARAFAPYTLPKENHFEPVDLAGAANRNPWAVDIFKPDSPDTTAVNDRAAGNGTWIFDFGPLEFWDTNCIPVDPATLYPARARAPRSTARNLAGLNFGAQARMDGIDFFLLSPLQNKGRAVWVLEHSEAREFALPENTRAVHFLGHFCGGVDTARRPGCVYEFVLSDGRTNVVELTYGKDYAPIGSTLGAEEVRRVNRSLCRYSWKSPGAPIRTLRVRDTGLGHQFVLGAITAELPGPARPEAWPAPARMPDPDGMIYGLEGPRASASSQVDPADDRTDAAIPVIADTLPDWKTNLLLTDFIGILENLRPVRFKAHVPNGDYEARVNLARMYADCRNDFYVKAQGESVFDRTESSYAVEPARVFLTTVTNGIFTLELGFREDDFEKNSNWAIRALELKRTKPARGN